MGQPPPQPTGRSGATVPAPPGAWSVAGPRLHTPPIPAHAPRAAGPVEFDPVTAMIRNRVIDRMIRMSVRHGAHAWRHRRDRPVGPHAVAFLYADPVPKDTPQDRQFFDVAAATRMVGEHPDVADLPRLLYRL